MTTEQTLRCRVRGYNHRPTAATVELLRLDRFDRTRRALRLVRDLKTDQLVAQARGACPDCGAEQVLDLAGRWRGRAEVACRDCHRMLRVEPENAG